MDHFTYPKTPFGDSPSESSDNISEISFDPEVLSPAIHMAPQFPDLRSRKPLIRFDLASPTEAKSPFADPAHSDSSAPGTPLQQMFPHEEDFTPMKRVRWGTTRTKTGRPHAGGVGRSKTLRKILRGGTLLRKNKGVDNEDSNDYSLDIIDDYASDHEPEAPRDNDPRDHKLETRLIVFNRTLPEDLVDPDSGLPINSYARNKIRTAKYTALSFLPKNLTSSFRRDIANNYFLFLIILGFFSIFGVTAPVLAAVPLIVIVVLGAIKESIEDSRRTALDMEVNNQPTHILSQVKEYGSYVYENRNVNDDNVSLWRRFKKWNTKILFRTLRGARTNLTKKGRAAKAKQALDDKVEETRKSFDSIADVSKRQSVFSSVSMAQNAPHERVLAFSRKTWKEVKVGDIVRVQNNEEIPADIMILSSSDEDNCCFVETKNLDGETNLKVKQALKFSTDHHKVHRANDFMNMDFEVDSEGPHPNLYTYEGRVNYSHDGMEMTESATINNLILRGCFLRNTKWIVGIVVFTGADSKIILNSDATPSKKSRISRELNYYVIINFVILFILCFVSGLVNGIYYHKKGTSRDFFEYGSPAGTPAKNGLVSFFVAVILYQALVPISLYLTIEIIKSIQAYLIYCDVGLYYDKLDFPCNPRSWSISDDLGQIEYIFSDKTGTLTQNLMEFRKCTINGVSYGRAYTEALAGLRKRQGVDVEQESRIEKAAIARDRVAMLEQLRTISENVYDDEITFVSKQLVADLKGASGHIQKECNEAFVLALALCHSVLTEEDPLDPKKAILKAQSPDEAALVGTARSLGFVFAGKTKRGFVLRVQGEKREYQILNTLEFNSTRKRMSAIIKLPGSAGESKVLLLCKGADSTIYSRLSETTNDAQMLETTASHLEEYATEGLRTLCLAKRELSWDEYTEWNKRHQEASSSLQNREAKMEAVADSIERELTLLGGTAIEDRLQDGVPESIAILGEAGIKLWVLTGDKVETAINIGFSCNLLGNDMELLVLKTELSDDEKTRYGVIPGDDNATIIERLVNNYLGRCFGMTGSEEELRAAKGNHSAPNERFGVVIDGDALKLALGDPEIQRKFLLLCKQCRAVLCCRVSPAQKAAVVKMVKDTLNVMTLAIGDGSNDVAMIQAADVGVGIAGEEGRQAAMSSDYALGQFRFLTRLLLTHGRWSYKRFAEMVPCFFYKNINYTVALFWYSVCNDFDGAYLFEYTYLMFYNLAFTAAPVILLGVFDQDVGHEVSMMVPQLYRAGIVGLEFTQEKFWVYLCDGLYQSMISFFFPYMMYRRSFQTLTGLAIDHRYFVGVLVTCISCIGSNLYVLMHQYRWDWASLLGVGLSCFVIFTWTGIWTLMLTSAEFYHAGAAMFGSLEFWACLAGGLLMCLVPRGFYDVVQKLYLPKDCDIIREQVSQGKFSMYPQGYDPTDPNRKLRDQNGKEPESEEIISDNSSDFQIISHYSVDSDTKSPSIVRANSLDKSQLEVSTIGNKHISKTPTAFYNDTASVIDTYHVTGDFQVEAIAMEDLVPDGEGGPGALQDAFILQEGLEIYDCKPIQSEQVSPATCTTAPHHVRMSLEMEELPCLHHSN